MPVNSPPKGLTYCQSTNFILHYSPKPAFETEASDLQRAVV